MFASVRSWLMVGKLVPDSHSTNRSAETLAFLAASWIWYRALLRAHTSSSGWTDALICSPMVPRSFATILLDVARRGSRCSCTCDCLASGPKLGTVQFKWVCLTMLEFGCEGRDT